jgi:hypothetical protein
VYVDPTELPTLVVANLSPRSPPWVAQRLQCCLSSQLTSGPLNDCVTRYAPIGRDVLSAASFSTSDSFALLMVDPAGMRFCVSNFRRMRRVLLESPLTFDSRMALVE